MTDRNSAYSDLLMRHRDMLWHLCWLRADGDRERGQDLLQDVFIALWNNFDKLRPNSSPKQERAWVQWQARSVFYQAKRRHTLPTIPLTDNITNNLTDEETLQRKELMDSILSTLNPDDQRIVKLYLEGYHGDEIGKTLGVNRDTVYQRFRRIVQKLRQTALILFALLLTSTITVAMVPQWRHFFFGGGKTEERTIDTISETTKTTPAALESSDTISAATKVMRPPLQKIEPLEKIDPIEIHDFTECSDPLSPIKVFDMPTISADGSRLTVTGANGEYIRVYDCGGRLVAVQKAGSICVIDLFPGTNPYFLKENHVYSIQIGNRSPLKIQL